MAGPSRPGLALIERAPLVEAPLWRRLRFESHASCREAIFDRYLWLARAVAGREMRRRPAYGLDRSDFQQLAYRGLLEAIDAFDPLQGPPFEAFARHRIRGAIADGVAQSSEDASLYSFRRRMQAERIRSLRTEQVDGADRVSELADLAAALAVGWIAEHARSVDAAALDAHAGLNPYETRSWRDMQISVLREIERLPPAERSIMQQHYVHGLAFGQIAQLLGLSKGRISQLHRSAILRVRESLRQVD